MRRRTIAALPLLALLPGTGRTQSFGARTILRVTGRIAEPGERDFTLADLEALGAVEMQTRTPWTGRTEQRFTGVPLARLLEEVRAEGTTLRSIALNDYAVTLPREDATERGAFLATRQDGEPLRIRDRGPTWLIYPWSARPELDIPQYRERAIWQIRQIDIR